MPGQVFAPGGMNGDFEFAVGLCGEAFEDVGDVPSVGQAVPNHQCFLGLRGYRGGLVHGACKPGYPDCCDQKEGNSQETHPASFNAQNRIKVIV